MTTITFRLHKQTVPGENLVMLGNLESLGCWHLSNSMKMAYTHHRTWEANLFIDDIALLTPEDAIIKWKFVQIYDTTSPKTPIDAYADLNKPISFQGQPCWEPGPDREVDLRNLEGTDHAVLEFTWSMHPEKGWITQIPFPTVGRLFQSPMPYHKEFDPHQQVFADWKREGVDVVVCLASMEEFRQATGRDILQFFSDEAIAFIYFPLKEGEVPQDRRDSLMKLLYKIHGLLEQHLTVAVFCSSGIQRTGLVLGCQLKRLWNDTDVSGLYTNPLHTHEQHLDTIRDTSIGLIQQTVHGALGTEEEQRFVLSI